MESPITSVAVTRLGAHELVTRTKLQFAKQDAVKCLAEHAERSPASYSEGDCVRGWWLIRYDAQVNVSL
jgi:hypothetical protein